MLRSIGAVAAGFAAMTVLVMVGIFAWMTARVPGGMAGMRQRMQAGGAAAMPATTPVYLAYNLALSFFAAVAGGWITTRIAASAPAGHLVALGAVILAMGLVSARMPGSEQQPGWYRIIIPFVSVGGVALSALLVRGGT